MEKQNNIINWGMLARYASEGLDKVEMAELESWLYQNPANKEILQQVVRVYEKDRHLAGIEKYQYYNTDIAYDKFLERVAKESSARRKSIRLWVRGAAAAGILLVSGLGFQYFNKQSGRNLLSAKHDSPKDIIWKQQRALNGHVLRIELTDGSTVRLSPGSRLIYPESFGNRERLVRLEGEAFFEVKRDELHPFVVRTPQLSTRVLGTSFNIEAYKEMVFTKVTLLTGKVAVSRNTENSYPDPVLAVLAPNESILFSNEDSTYLRTTIKPADAQAIKDGKLVFDGESMKDIALKIALHYDVRVRIEDPAIETMTFTGTFDHIALEKLTAMIERAMGLTIVQEGNNLYIRK